MPGLDPRPHGFPYQNKKARTMLRGPSFVVPRVLFLLLLLSGGVRAQEPLTSLTDSLPGAPAATEVLAVTATSEGMVVDLDLPADFLADGLDAYTGDASSPTWPPPCGLTGCAGCTSGPGPGTPRPHLRPPAAHRAHRADTAPQSGPGAADPGRRCCPGRCPTARRSPRGRPAAATRSAAGGTDGTDSLAQ